MKDREKYFIAVEGHLVEVTKEVYEVYYRAERKERHFLYELKAGRRRIDKNTGQKIWLPSLEDSYDKLVDAHLQFEDNYFNTEEQVILNIMLEKLQHALKLLSVDEMYIIRQLYYEDVSEVKLAEKLGIPRRTLRDKKKRILEKLRKLIV